MRLHDANCVLGVSYARDMVDQRRTRLPPSLSRKLREALGTDAGGDLVTWLDEQREESAQMRADMAELRQEMHAMEMRIDKRFDRMDAMLAERFAQVDTRIAEVRADLLKWSFLFWTGSVAAIAALAGVLRG
jgi:hypothetical protein